jgi:hypothetical protein
MTTPAQRPRSRQRRRPCRASLARNASAIAPLAIDTPTPIVVTAMINENESVGQLLDAWRFRQLAPPVDANS